MTDSAAGWVFGYGSLVGGAPGAFPGELTGARRAWTVAMDNSLDLPGYKHYVDDDGRRPAVGVAFLDLVRADGSVDGLCRPVTTDDLAVLDRRERQYDRVDVTDRVPGARGRTWTYTGREDSRARAAAHRRAGTLVVVTSYLRTVQRAFDTLGPGARARFDTSTDAPGVPVVDLRRVEVA